MKKNKSLISLKDLIHFLYDITRYSNLNIYQKKEEILSYILRKTVKLMNAKAGNIRLYEPKSESLVLVASYGTSKKYREEKRRIRVGESIAGVAFQKKKLFTVKDIRKSKLYIKPELAIELREELKNFYSVLKDADQYLKLVFITGVTKFSKVSIFSELNNLTDLTMQYDYNELLGITEDEIEKYLTYLVITTFIRMGSRWEV